MATTQDNLKEAFAGESQANGYSAKVSVRFLDQQVACQAV